MKKLSIIITMVFALSAIACGKKDDKKKAEPTKVTAKEGDKAKGEVSKGPDREHRGSPEPSDPKPADGTATPVAADPAATDAEAEKLLTEFGPKVEEFMKAVVAAVAAGNGDCAKIAPPAIKLFNDNAALLANMTKTNHSAAADKWKAAHGPLMLDFGKTMPALAKCAAENEVLAAALAALPKGT